MTEPVLPGMPEEQQPAPRSGPGKRADRSGSRSRRAPKRRSGCLPVLLVVAIFAGVVFWFGRGVVSDVRDMFAGAPDYSGPGTGEVTVTIDPGQSVASMGDELEKLGVVKSADAFVDAARANSDSSRIQAATYLMRKEMAAADAVELLADPANAGSGRKVTIPEGARLDQIVTAVSKATGFKPAELNALLKAPAKIGLPKEAEGNPEGYLFPATYEITDATTAQGLLSQMVAQTEKVEQELDITAKAERLGLTPHEIITVASIIEYEANNTDDYPKVARVLYNRLDDGMKLQLDSTVSYVSKRKGDVFTTDEERASDSPYNTYRFEGLPPGPIGSPGRDTIEAALNPARGTWIYFVPDYENDTTVFSTTLAEHNKAVAKLQAYCRQSDDC